MKKLFVLLITATLSLCMCNNPSDEGGSKDSVAQDSTAVIPMPSQEEVQQYALNSLKNSEFIKGISIEGNRIHVVFVSSYDEYKAANPYEGAATEESYQQFTADSSLLERLLIETPVKLFRKYEGAQSVVITLPAAEVTLSTTITRAEVEQHTGKTIAEISEKWAEVFHEPYLQNEEGRQNWVKKYVKKQ